MTYRRTKFTIGIGVIVMLLGVLAYLGMKSSMVAYINIKDLKNSHTVRTSSIVKVMGVVKPGSITPEDNEHEIKFILTDSKQPKYNIVVNYSGIVPDNFKPGNDVVVEGTLLKNNTFQANQLLAKCPSKYNTPVKNPEDKK